MRTFTLIYSETGKQVWALILIPVSITTVYITFLEVFGYSVIPFLLSVCLFIGIVALTMLWIMNRVVNLPAKVTVLEDRLLFELKHSNFLYRQKHFEVPLENIVYLTEDVNTQNDYRTYFNIKTLNPSKTIFVMQPRMVADKQIAEFSSLLHSYIDRYNQKPGIAPAAKIREGSFYDAKWALVLTCFIYALVAGVSIALFSGWTIAWYKALQVYVLSAIWLMAYHTNAHKKVKV